MTTIVFDSSVLISISEKCFLRILKRFKEKNNIRFVIPQSVFDESVSRPESIRRFELNAVRLHQAVLDGWIELVQGNESTQKLVAQISAWSNNSFLMDDKPLRLLQAGELETLALFKQLNADALAIDERTCRMILEDPFRLKSLISKRQDKPVFMDHHAVDSLTDFLHEPLIVRSCDLLGLAFRQNLFEEDMPQSKQCLEAALWAVKFAGCAVSGGEIDEYLKKG